ncbi:hypothetical protein BC830DRAFT_607581 [Chytriomyces sp. MP71]|nr:hypothetical protein BC830DRAFT_607581 [Chytriomyces sp. MP71]
MNASRRLLKCTLPSQWGLSPCLLASDAQRTLKTGTGAPDFASDLRLSDTEVGSMKTSQVAVQVWWDSGCPLCRREIAFLRRLDTRARIRFHDLRDPSVAASCPRDPSHMLAAFHAQELRPKEGPLVHGAAAFALMWRQVDFTPLRWLGEAMGRSERVLKVAEWGYGVFLRRVRPGMQRVARWVEGDATGR